MSPPALPFLQPNPTERVVSLVHSTQMTLSTSFPTLPLLSPAAPLPRRNPTDVAALSRSRRSSQPWISVQPPMWPISQITEIEGVLMSKTVEALSQHLSSSLTPPPPRSNQRHLPRPSAIHVLISFLPFLISLLLSPSQSPSPCLALHKGDFKSYSTARCRITLHLASVNILHTTVPTEYSSGVLSYVSASLSAPLPVRAQAVTSVPPCGAPPTAPGRCPAAGVHGCLSLPLTTVSLILSP